MPASKKIAKKPSKKKSTREKDFQQQASAENYVLEICQSFKTLHLENSPLIDLLDNLINDRAILARNLDIVDKLPELINYKTHKDIQVFIDYVYDPDSEFSNGTKQSLQQFRLSENPSRFLKEMFQEVLQKQTFSKFNLALENSPHTAMLKLNMTELHAKLDDSNNDDSSRQEFAKHFIFHKNSVRISLSEHDIPARLIDTLPILSIMQRVQAASINPLNLTELHFYEKMLAVITLSNQFGSLRSHYNNDPKFLASLELLEDAYRDITQKFNKLIEERAQVILLENNNHSSHNKKNIKECTQKLAKYIMMHYGNLDKFIKLINILNRSSSKELDLPNITGDFPASIQNEFDKLKNLLQASYRYEVSASTLKHAGLLANNDKKFHEAKTAARKTHSSNQASQGRVKQQKKH